MRLCAFGGWREAIILGNESNFLEGNLNKKHFCGKGGESEFSRSSVGEIGEGIREGKETAILINSTFCIWEFFGRSLVLLWFLLGLLHEGNREGTKVGNLNKRHLCMKHKWRFSGILRS